MSSIIFKEESYQIVGACMDVHRELGLGFLEAVYKEALELEFRKRGIKYKREQVFSIHYKEQLLKHRYYADFVVMDKIILEIKAANGIANEHIAQTLNYLAISKFKLAILVNFNALNLQYKRLVL